MKHIPLLVAAAAFVSSATVLAAERTVSLTVDNMTCASCPHIVKRALTRVDGVTKAEVSLEAKQATVTFDDAVTDEQALIEATSKAGFPARAAQRQ